MIVMPTESHCCTQPTDKETLDYWKRRCFAAEDCLDSLPCEFRFYGRFLEKYNEWRRLLYIELQSTVFKCP